MFIFSLQINSSILMMAGKLTFERKIHSKMLLEHENAVKMKQIIIKTWFTVIWSVYTSFRTPSLYIKMNWSKMIWM